MTDVDWLLPSTTTFVVACTSRTRYFDLDAVRTPVKHPNATHTIGKVDASRGDYGRPPATRLENNPAGAPPLDTWITHDPGEVLERFVKSMCPPDGLVLISPEWEGHPVSNARFIIGNSLDVVRSMPAGSVDLIITSPPFLALRSYLPSDHPDKALEVGSEPTPAAFIDTLLEHTAEWRRVLAPHGSLCVELGDTYSGSGGAGGDYTQDGLREGQPAFVGSGKRQGNQRNDKVEMAARGIIGTTSGERAKANVGTWPEAKSLCLIPELYRVALVYGRNPLRSPLSAFEMLDVIERWHTIYPSGSVDVMLDYLRLWFAAGERHGRGPVVEYEPWRARNVVRWHRPNPPVGALGDKFRPATSDMVVACTSRTRYFDLDAVREPSMDTRPRNTNGPKAKAAAQEVSSKYDTRTTNPAGAPPLDTWIIPTEPFSGSHYATWPRALLTKPIAAMCPSRVCVTCGEPSRRITEPSERWAKVVGKSTHDHTTDERGRNHPSTLSDANERTAEYVTVGWTDCGHNTWRNGLVLDPFGGSGTTAAVATGHGRDAVLIDLDERNADLAYERVGFFLSVERHSTPEAAA